MKDREFSIEDSYQIFAFFMPEFWWNFLKGVMLERGLISDGMTPEEHEKASEEEKLKDVSKEIKLETVQSTRSNFLVWKDFSD